jgi:hypothetical protein
MGAAWHVCLKLKMDLQEVGWGGMDYIGRYRWQAVWCSETLGSIKCGEFLD